MATFTGELDHKGRYQRETKLFDNSVSFMVRFLCAGFNLGFGPAFWIKREGFS
jgi:hypothetical protein